MTAIVTAPGSSGTVNLREKPNGALVDKIDSGTKATVTGSKTDAKGVQWSKVTIGKRSGWMMSEFLIADDSQIPAEDPDDFVPGDADDQDGRARVALYFTVEELAQLLPVLQKAEEQIIEKVGRG